MLHQVLSNSIWCSVRLCVCACICRSVRSTEYSNHAEVSVSLNFSFTPNYSQTIAIAFYHVAANATSDCERISRSTLVYSNNHERTAEISEQQQQRHIVLVLNWMWSKYTRQSIETDYRPANLCRRFCFSLQLRSLLYHFWNFNILRKCEALTSIQTHCANHFSNRKFHANVFVAALQCFHWHTTAARAYKDRLFSRPTENSTQ